MGTHTEVEVDGQYRELREDAGWLARDRSILAFRGPDAASLLQGQLTNDVEALAVGEGCYAALLDRKGHLQADMRVLRVADDDFLVDLDPAGVDAAQRHFQLYRLGSEVELETLDVQVVSIIGPRSARALGEPALAAEGANAELGIGGVTARAVATDQGVDLLVAPEALATLTSALAGAGVAAVGEAAAEIVRVESGRPRLGLDMPAGTMPAEAGITERAVSFGKGCYIGQETVARLHYRGKPNRHLRGLRLDAPVSTGDVVRGADRELGTVGSVALSPARGPLALAILRREAAPGDRVDVGVGVSEGGTPATVVELPFSSHE